MVSVSSARVGVPAGRGLWGSSLWDLPSLVMRGGAGGGSFLGAEPRTRYSLVCMHPAPLPLGRWGDALGSGQDSPGPCPGPRSCWGPSPCPARWVVSPPSALEAVRSGLLPCPAVRRVKAENRACAEVPLARVRVGPGAFTGGATLAGEDLWEVLQRRTGQAVAGASAPQGEGAGVPRAAGDPGWGRRCSLRRRGPDCSRTGRWGGGLKVLPAAARAQNVPELGGGSTTPSGAGPKVLPAPAGPRLFQNKEGVVHTLRPPGF